MKTVEEWYEQWSHTAYDIVSDVTKNNEIKIKKIKEEIIKNIDMYSLPIYKKYTRYESKSIVDISLIYDKVVDGVHVTKLTNKRSKVDNHKVIYEYGFNNENKCMYRKCINQDREEIDRVYIYFENITYELKVSNFVHKDVNKMTIAILGEYRVDNDCRLSQIIRHYGIMNCEEYQWLNKNVALINCGVKQYLLLLKQEEPFMIFEIIHPKDNKIFSYQTQRYVYLNNVDYTLSNQIKLDDMEIESYDILDLNQKMTEYKRLCVLDTIYLVSKVYTQLSKEFSYKKAKEVYIKEIYGFIKYEMKSIDFKVRYINIQYFNYGYSVMDISVGFDDECKEDVHSMRVVKDVEFSKENYELIMDLNTYVNERLYYKSFKKNLELLKELIEEEYKIIVSFIEVVD